MLIDELHLPLSQIILFRHEENIFEYPFRAEYFSLLVGHMLIREWMEGRGKDTVTNFSQPLFENLIIKFSLVLAIRNINNDWTISCLELELSSLLYWFLQKGINNFNQLIVLWRLGPFEVRYICNIIWFFHGNFCLLNITLSLLRLRWIDPR